MVVELKGFIDDLMEINYMELRLKFANQWPLSRMRIIIRNYNFHILERERHSDIWPSFSCSQILS